MEKIEYVVQIGFDSSGDWEWEDAQRFDPCSTLEGAHRAFAELADLEYGTLRIIKRTTTEVVVPSPL